MKNYKNNKGKKPFKRNTNNKSFSKDVKETSAIDINSTALTISKAQGLDVVADAIVSHVGTNAPLIGKFNAIQNLKYKSDQKGSLKGGLFEKYQSDTFKFLASATRSVPLYYRGINIADVVKTGKVPLSAQEDIKSWSYLEAFLQANQDTDMNIFKYQFEKSQQVTAAETNVINTFQSPANYLLHSYQQRLQLSAAAALSYEQLIAYKSILMQLFPKYAKAIMRTIGELQATRRRRNIEAIKTQIANSFFDVQYFTDYVVPSMIASKQTDGLNSPFKQLHPAVTFSTMKVKSTLANATALTPYPTMGATVSGDTITHLVNSFSVHEFIKAMKANTLDAWLKNVDTVLTLWDKETTDFALTFTDVRAFLDKISSDATLRWTTGMQISELDYIDKMVQWLVTDEMLVHIAKYEANDKNGYQIEVPFYSDGLHVNDTITEYHKFFLYVEDEICYVQPGETLQVIFRTGEVYNLTADAATATWTVKEAVDKDKVELVSKLLSLRLPRIAMTVANNQIVVSHPEFEDMTPVRHISMVQEDILEHRASFVFPINK